MVIFAQDNALDKLASPTFWALELRQHALAALQLLPAAGGGRDGRAFTEGAAVIHKPSLPSILGPCFWAKQHVPATRGLSLLAAACSRWRSQRAMIMQARALGMPLQTLPTLSALVLGQAALS